MDPEALRDEVDEWVREGIISEEQAEEVLRRYEPAEPGLSRAVLALSLVGAALVFVGVTWFLATNWHDLPRLGRASFLVMIPGLAYAGGILAYTRQGTRIGHALIVLGAILVGPSLFLLEDLFAVTIPNVWLFLGWTAIALPTGHALDSRPGTVVGLLVLVALAVELTDPTDPAAVIGLLGLVLFVLGSTRTTQAAWVYRVVGVAIAIAALLLLTTWEGNFGRYAIDLTATLAAGVLGALAGAVWLYLRGYHSETQWIIAGFVAITISVTTATFAPDLITDLLGFTGVHMGSLILIIATGYLGYRTQSRAFIDLAVVGALLQTLSFVAATVVDELSGAVALVVAGLILLLIGLGLERGRRSILDSIGI